MDRYLLMVRLLVLSLLGLLAGCRTYGTFNRLQSVPLEKECQTPAQAVTPTASRIVKSIHQSAVQHWTTGDNAKPPAWAPSLDEATLVGKTLTEQLEASIVRDMSGLEHNPSLNEQRVQLPREIQSEDNEQLCWRASLDSLASFAIQNNQVIRRDADFFTTRPTILDSPEAVPTSLDANIQRSGYLFGQRGVAAALSDFDSQARFSTIWGRDESIQNNRLLSGGILPGDALVEEVARSTMELAKNLRSGGRARLFHTWDYNWSNRDDLLFPSVYRGTLGAELRQPLLAGAGRFYTDVAGPPGDLVRGVTGVSQGGLIARNESRVAQLELEKHVADLLTDIELLFWQLHASRINSQQLRELEVQLIEFEAVLEARVEGGTDTDTSQLISMRQLRLRGQQLAKEEQHQCWETQQRLMRLLSIPPEIQIEIATEGRFPPAAFVPDDMAFQRLATKNRIEIRRQTYRIRNTDLQIRAAQSLLLPQLDGVATYQLNGFGDHLLSRRVPGPDEAVQSAYHNLFEGDQTGWNLGFEFTHTLGRRLERTRLRNLRLQGQKQRILLHEQEQEIKREVVIATKHLESKGELRQLAIERAELSRDALLALQARYGADDDQVTVEMLADATFQQAQSEVMTVRADADYAQALVRLNAAAGCTLCQRRLEIASNVGEGDLKSR